MPNENSQSAISAVLKHLGVPLSVENKDARLIMQKTIYLSQAAGAKLGYAFNWYVNGPYSAPLADDYYEATQSGKDFARYTVSSDLAQKLQPVKRAIEARPSNVSQVQWFEAIGSLDYIGRVWRTPKDQIVEECAKHKPALKDILPDAFEALQTSGLVL